MAIPNVLLARAFWLLLNLAALWAMFALVAQLLYQQGFSLADRVGTQSLDLGILLVPAVFTHLYISNNFSHLQINLILFSLVLFGLRLYVRKRELAAGAMIGFCAAAKIMPVIFIPYFCYKGKFKMAFSVLAAFALFSVSPAFVFGWTGLVSSFGKWFVTVNEGWGVGRMNQSIFALIDRLVGHEMVPFLVNRVDYIPNSKMPLVYVVWIGITLLVAILAAISFKQNTERGSPAEILEWGIVLIAAASFGPVCWKAYLVVMYLPVGFLWKERKDAKSQGQRGVQNVLTLFFLIFVLLTSFATPDLLGRAIVGRLEMASVHAWGVLLTLGILFWLRFRLLATGDKRMVNAPN